MEDRTAYLGWNDRLAALFFRPEMAGRSVHLYATTELVSGLGIGTLDDFLKAVKVGPSWVPHRMGICQKAYRTFKNWRRKELLYPPYIAYLGLFVLAAGLEGDFAPYAYYPRLRTLIGEPPGSTVPSFHRMLDLWDDLERWSNHDKRGELGVFNIHIAGSWIHVGLPIAQTILTERERKSLPLIFAEARLDPASPPSDIELARLLQEHGAEYLRPRTLHLLASQSNEADLHEVLLETIKEELSDWDGSIDVASSERGAPGRSTFGNLRLCLSLDRVAGRIKVTLRCSLSRDYPDDGLFLKSRQFPEVLACEEFLPGWSSTLQLHTSGIEIDASKYSWKSGLELEEERLGWRFRLPASPIRIFVSGAREGLPGLIEIRQLPRSQPFYILAHEECSRHLQAWGESGCKEFKELGINEGLPPNWHCFTAAEALDDEPIRKIYPVLSFASIVRLLLRHGIRSSQGNSFFRFAAPEIILEGGTGAEMVLCEGHERTCSSETGTYSLPEDLQSDRKLAVQVKRGDDILKQRSLYLVDDFNSHWIEPTRFFGRFGELLIDQDLAAEGIAGAYAKDVPATEYRFEPNPLAFDSDEVVFLGRVPGQIALYPLEALPATWTPIWAVPLRKQRTRAIFCGTSINTARPVDDSTCDKRKLKRWKEVLWHWRKRIVPPPEPSLRSLWRQFQEIARHV